MKSGFVFIAMPMSPDDPSLEDVHEALKDVAQDLGLTAERTDDVQTNEQITHRIIKSLEQAEFVVVDLSNSRTNVYYEAGYAEALGKTPIYIAKADTDIGFDVHDYPVIFFKNMTGLKRDLKKRLQGLMDQKRKKN